MPIFMVERQFAEELDLTADDADGVNRINDDESVRWLYSFLSDLIARQVRWWLVA